ncbi:hypothetical protein ACFQ1I_35965 [Kitasatospora arboriphila]
MPTVSALYQRVAKIQNSEPSAAESTALAARMCPLRSSGSRPSGG